MNSEITVRAAIDCLEPTGERLTLYVEIGKPYKTSDGPWACPVRIRGMYDNLVDIRGQDSLQAFCLAASLVRSLLTGVIENGGQLLHPSSNDPYELDPIFGSVGKPPEQRI
jgi:hypothetical protein